MTTERSSLDNSPTAGRLGKVCMQYFVMFTSIGIAATFGAAVIISGTKMLHHRVDDRIHTTIWALRAGVSAGAILGTLLYPAIMSHGAILFSCTRKWFLNNTFTKLNFLFLLVIGIACPVVFGVTSGVLGLSALYLLGIDEGHFLTIIKIGCVSGVVIGLGLTVGLMLMLCFGKKSGDAGPTPNETESQRQAQLVNGTGPPREPPNPPILRIQIPSVGGVLEEYQNEVNRVLLELNG